MEGVRQENAMSVRAAAGWAIGSQYTAFALQFLTSVILARWFISPQQLGQFSIAFAAVSLIAFLQDFGVNRYIAGERELTSPKLQTAFTLSVCFAWSIALLCLLAAWPIAWLYDDPQLLPITLIVAASYLCVPLAIVPQALCQRRMDYRSNTMIEIGAALANATVALVLAMRGHGALALAWGAFAQQAARLAVSQWRIGGMLPWPLRIGDARTVLELGAANSAQVSCNTVSARAPELVIGQLIGAAAVGLFARAAGLALQLRQLVAGAVTGVFYPAFRQVRDRGDPLGPPYLRVVAAFTGITWPAMAGIAVLAGPLISMLYGERWLAAAPLLGWVALAQICYAALPLNADLPMLLGRMRGAVLLLVIETAVSLLLLLLAVQHGLEWVAASRLAHGVCWVLLWAPFMRTMLELPWRALLLVYLRSGIATLAAIAPTLALYRLIQGPAQAGPVQVLCGVAAGIACWFVALTALRHPLAAEIADMLGMLRRRLMLRPTA